MRAISYTFCCRSLFIHQSFETFADFFNHKYIANIPANEIQKSVSNRFLVWRYNSDFIVCIRRITINTRLNIQSIFLAIRLRLNRSWVTATTKKTNENIRVVVINILEGKSQKTMTYNEPILSICPISTNIELIWTNDHVRLVTDRR